MICVIFVHYSHEISLVNYAEPNQDNDFVRYNREFVITVIVITEFDCIKKFFAFYFSSNIMYLNANPTEVIKCIFNFVITDLCLIKKVTS